MKNIVQFNNNVNCASCSLSGFFSTTPHGGDCNTCPLCNGYNWEYTLNNDEYNKYLEKYEKNIENESLNFCNNCKILYDVGCIHAVNGCSSDIYNGHVVRKWKYNEHDYIGMPCFDDLDEYLAKINDIKIVELICPNNGLHCSHGYYPKEIHSHLYDRCFLNK